MSEPARADDTAGVFVLPEPAFGRVPRLTSTVERGMLVRHGDRLLLVLGFDPMGVVSPCVYLEDVKSGEQVTVPLADLAA
jgi:hypothetical protein